MQEVEVLLDGLWRPIVMHPDCATAMTTDFDAYARTMQRLYADYELYQRVVNTRLATN